MKRLTLKLKTRARKFVLQAKGPIPRVGDICTIDGQDWEVVKVEDVEPIAVFAKQAGALKQVFP